MMTPEEVEAIPITEEQKEFIRYYMHTTGKTMIQLCDDYGIDVIKAWSFLDDENVKLYMENYTMLMMKMSQYKTFESLMRNIEVGDTKSITYLLDHTMFKEDKEKEQSIKDIKVQVKLD